MSPARRHQRTPSDAESSAGTAPEDASTLRRSVAEATERIRGIIDAAEEVAGEIRADAEREAQRYLTDQRREADKLTTERAETLSRLGRDVAQHAAAVRERTEAMLRALDDVSAQVSATAEEPRAPGGRSVAPPPPPTPPEPPEAGDVDVDGSDVDVKPGSEDEILVEVAPSFSLTSLGEVEESAMLRATQMAVAGSARADIGRTLESEFGIADADTILDEILGPG